MERRQGSGGEDGGDGRGVEEAERKKTKERRRQWNEGKRVVVKTAAMAVGRRKWKGKDQGKEKAMERRRVSGGEDGGDGRGVKEMEVKKDKERRRQ
jgi:hypothetical protein